MLFRTGCSVRVASARRAVGRSVRISLIALPGLLGVPANFAQHADTQPATAVTSADVQARAADLLAIIEGQNSAQAREIGVRELLRLNWADAPQRLATILAGANVPAKMAVAAVLADTPEQLDAVYVEPLLTMLGASDPGQQRAASAALMAYRDGSAVARLEAITLDENSPQALREAAVETLGLVPRRDAMSVLVKTLDNAPEGLASAALAALERSTGMNFGGSRKTATDWWAETSRLAPDEWLQRQIERLVRQQRDAIARVNLVQTRLTRALREGYLRAPDAERPTILQSYLSDALPEVRLTGLELVRTQRAEGRTLAPETMAMVRGLLSSADAAIRTAAVNTVASFREATDSETLRRMLDAESVPEVRQALVNGLGYVGGTDVVGLLLDIVRRNDPVLRNEAVTALGRLGERGVLSEEGTKQVSAALAEAYEAIPAEQVALRERLLWAMGRVGNGAFRPVFAAALGADEDLVVRQAAARGLAVLGDDESLAVLMRYISDADPVVRKTAAETVAKAGQSDAALEALWERSKPTVETDESIRTAAWRGVLRMMANRQPSFVEKWIEQLPAGGDQRAGRILDLLLVSEKTLASAPNPQPALGLLRARIATERLSAGQTDEAISAFVAALADLRSVNSPEAPRVATGLLRLLMQAGRYDAAQAELISQGAAGLDGRDLWASLQPELEAQLTEEHVEKAVGNLKALLENPPVEFAPETTAQIQTLLKQAMELQAGFEHATSQPASRAAETAASQGTVMPEVQ